MSKAPAPSGSSRLTRGAAISSLAVMGSRVMGLVREQIFAYFFGASREYDAFLTAFRIPNLLRDLLAEGALSSAFVTTFSKDLQTGGTERAYHVANLVVNALSLLLLVLVGAGIFFAPQIVSGIALGFDPDKAALATTLTRMMFPFIFFVALAAVAMGMLNAQDRYAIPQSASTFFNITSIAAGLTSAYLFAPNYMVHLWHHGSGVTAPQEASRAMMGMAIGTLCGGLVQWLIQIPSLFKLGYRWRPVLDWSDPSFRAVLKLMGPAIVGAAAVQINVFVNSNFASLLGDKPISWLNYAFRLMQFPIGVFGVAVMTAALPALSRHIASGDQEGFGTTLTRSLELVLCLTLPATVGLAVLGEPIMRLIYEHGRFSHLDTLQTAAALSAYAFGLPGYSAMKVVQPAYVAMGDAKTPMYTALTAVVVNACLNFTFVKVLNFGHVGLALSTSMMASANVTVLIILLEWRRPTLERAHLMGQLSRIALACAAMGAVAWVGYLGLQARGFGHGGRMAFFELMVLMPACGLVYMGAARLFGVTAFNSMLSLILRRRNKR